MVNTRLIYNKIKENIIPSPQKYFLSCKTWEKFAAKDTSDTSYKTGQMNDANQRQPHDVAALIYISFHLRSTRSSLFGSYMN